jgi:hypothetical protein
MDWLVPTYSFGMLSGTRLFQLRRHHGVCGSFESMIFEFIYQSIVDSRQQSFRRLELHRSFQAWCDGGFSDVRDKKGTTPPYSATSI